MPNPTFIIDNGAYTIKLGFASDEAPKIIPNCKMKVKSERQRQYIGDQIEECKDRSCLFYVLPHQRGFIINWDVEREIWEYSISHKFKNLNPKETDLIITEPYFNFKAIQNNTDEVLFEEYNFKSIFRTDTGFLSSFHHAHSMKNPSAGENGTIPEEVLACLVVDSGFSFTHVAPYIHNEEFGFTKLDVGVRRIDVGGKALTNHLKDIVSFRQMDVSNETYVMNQCKEDVCFVAKDFEAALRECEQDKQNAITRDYVLPDFTNLSRGHVRKPDFRANRLQSDPTKINEPQFLRLANERFQVPEILFNPSDIGINQVGIVEAIVDSIESVPKRYQHLLYSNIILTGGNANISGFYERVLQGVRSYCPCEYKAHVYISKDPITYPWHGGKILATNRPKILEKLVVTKQQFEEAGDIRRQR